MTLGAGGAAGTAAASAAVVRVTRARARTAAAPARTRLVATQARVDYFPSYEIITHPAYRGRFFAQNMRSVLAEGVDHVMAQFFRDQAAAFGGELAVAPASEPVVPVAEEEPEMTEAEELRCEEEILAAFAPDQRHA